MGLDIYLEWNKTDEEEAHYNAGALGFMSKGDVGYLRSSYNERGFNRWAHRYIGGKDFYYIFQPPDPATLSEKGFYPAWDACMERAKIALVEAKKVRDQPRLVSLFLHEPVGSEAEALKVFGEEVAAAGEFSLGGRKGFNWYMNQKGDFFLGEPPTVLAVIPTKSFGSTTLTLICKPGKDEHKFYIDLLEKEVPAFIKLGKAKNATICWSG